MVTTPVSPPKPVPPPSISRTEPQRDRTQPAIEVEHLVRKFDTFTAVDDVSFSVAPGEVFGFLGPNGAGKSTTIKMLCTLLKPTSGTARIDGHDVVRDPAGVRNAIGIIFQDYSLDDRITAVENLRFHCMIYHVPRGVRAERIAQVLAMVNLTDRANDRVRTFSGGMKRRLEIARGLLHHPSVLFLDEPTVGLDPQTRQNIWEHINELRREHGITVFMTTHYMDEAEYCDRIAIMDHARLIALDTPFQLKASLGGDRIRLRTEDNEAAVDILGSRYGLEALIEDGRVVFAVTRGDEFAPDLLRTFPIPVQSIEIAHPTLNDVFLQMTGREIRDEGADKHDKLRAQMQRRGKRGA
jgi:ABC-2 type transport system ATP-binding protein